MSRDTKEYGLFARSRAIGAGVLLTLWFVLTGCGNGSQTPYVPLPKAWPRLNVAASADMDTVFDGPVPVLVNPSTSRAFGDNGVPSLTVTYPSAATDIYYTFVPVGDESEKEEVLRNREQRISLNLNGLEASTLKGSGPGGTAVLVVARGATQTPVQLLADMGRFVVTATAFVKNRQTAQSYDSIAPLVDVLVHDMKRTLPGLTYDTTTTP